jgi:hypothetical protein
MTFADLGQLVGFVELVNLFIWRSDGKQPLSFGDFIFEILISHLSSSEFASASRFRFTRRPN